MKRVLNSFKISSGNKILDYRLGGNLDLSKIKRFFQKSFDVKKLWNGNRHVLGILAKGNQVYFLKLSTSEGIGIVTKNEYRWNNYFNKFYKGLDFRVPKNCDKGIFKKEYFYLITDYFEGKPPCNLMEYIPQILKLSEEIQKLPCKRGNYKARFLWKVRAWFGDVPKDVSKKYNVKTLLDIVEEGINGLSSKPRHGDFAPWHIIKLPGNKLGLIDGEHALRDGVENYDICYFIQRVFSVLKNPQVADEVYSKLLEKEYEKDMLKVVLASRAIGGYLDESLAPLPNYEYAAKFHNWIINL